MENLETPLVRLASVNGSIELHYFNSRIRTFRDKQFDHVELYEDDQIKGIRVGRAVLDTLFEHEFPMQFDPYVDDSTYEWFVASEMSLLDKELE